MNYFFALEETAANPYSSFVSIGMIVLMLLFFYFILYRPQKKQEKAAAEMKNNLEVGDEITTIGGIVGEIVSIKGETITIETSKARTKIRFLKDAVKTVDVKANGEIPSEKAPAKKSKAIEPEKVKDEKPEKVKEEKSEKEENN